ncbi:MAG: hypothetical protein AAF141_11140 [Pseudomonadota bacterium]
MARDFDPLTFIEAFGLRFHFAHLRNTLLGRDHDVKRAGSTVSEHLLGDIYMVATIRAVLAAEHRRRDEEHADHDFPFRPDHALLSNFDRRTQSGYPLVC